MMNTLEVVRAGAGSGKTTNLCQTVADAVAAGLDPARILATTFTKKAAAELKGRVQAKLLAGNGDRAAARFYADRLELAAMGTVHSVAHQLLGRYAIELGLSPRLEVITDEGSSRTLRDLLGTIPLETWQPLADCAERLGIADLNRQILSLLAAKRGNRISDEAFAVHMTASAERVCELLAPNGVTDETPISTLYDLAEQALSNINALNDTQKNTDEARQKLRRLQSTTISLWGTYLEAGKIQAGKKSGADGMLDSLRIHASQVRQNPRLHADVREFSSLLAEETIRLESQYAKYKAERGLVDFTDLEVLLLHLLENEQLAARLANDFDLVLVDEFQDTNPLQLAIFQQLRNFVQRNRWVGDPKQAIYGFRDTDPQLVNDVWERVPEDDRSTLPNNHRSQRGLVQLVGALFRPALGVDAQQEPQRAANPRGIERWMFQSRNQPQDATALACGIAQLHDEGTRFGDIAVLERTNRLLGPLASVLDSLGIPYLLESPGLFSTREGAMLLAGLRLVADRNDSLAAASILHLLGDPTRSTPEWIADRLTALHAAEQKLDDEDDSGGKATCQLPWESDPRLAPLERIDRTLLSPSLISQEVIEALDLPSHIQKWGNPARRCSNLDSALTHARKYEDDSFSSGEAVTLSGLILYFEQLAADDRDMRYTSQGHDAVTLMTYHAAKGLEWPVVVLSGLHATRSPNMWLPAVTGGANTEADPLVGRTLRSWIWPFGETDGQFGGPRKGSGLEDDALNSPEGIEKAVREGDENLRLLYVGCTRAREKVVFAHRSGQYDWLKRLENIDTVLNPDLADGEHELDGIDTTLVIRHLSPDMADDLVIQPSQQEQWIATPSNLNARNTVERFHSPSQVLPQTSVVSFDTTELTEQSFFSSTTNDTQYQAIGDAVHSYMAAIPSMRLLGESERLLVAERCLSAYSVTGVIPPSVLVSSGQRFCQWVESNYPEARWHSEIPVSGPRSDGGQWIGTIDLALQLPDASVVIVDHKSAPIRREHCAAKASAYAEQLAAYSEVFQADGTIVEAAWIHFPLAGVVAKRKD